LDHVVRAGAVDATQNQGYGDARRHEERGICMIETHRFDPTKLVEVSVGGGDFIEWLHAPINHEGCVAGFAEFRSGGPDGSFPLWYPEVQYALSGEAEMVYRLPPVYDSELTLSVAAGDLWFVPTGTQVRFQVSTAEPFRILYAIMPRPESFGDEMEWVKRARV